MYLIINLLKINIIVTHPYLNNRITIKIPLKRRIDKHVKFVTTCSCCSCKKFSFLRKIETILYSTKCNEMLCYLYHMF